MWRRGPQTYLDDHTKAHPTGATVNTLSPIVVEQIMRDHMDRANGYRRASALRVKRERADRKPRVRRAVGAFVGRLAA
jgi:hypothetical protein